MLSPKRLLLISSQWRPHSEQLKHWVATGSSESHLLELARNYVSTLCFEKSIFDVDDGVDLLSLLPKISYPTGGHVTSKLQQHFTHTANQLTPAILRSIIQHALGSQAFAREFAVIASSQAEVLDSILHILQSQPDAGTTESIDFDDVLAFVMCLWSAVCEHKIAFVHSQPMLHILANTLATRLRMIHTEHKQLPLDQEYEEERSCGCAAGKENGTAVLLSANCHHANPYAREVQHEKFSDDTRRVCTKHVKANRGCKSIKSTQIIQDGLSGEYALNNPNGDIAPSCYRYLRELSSANVPLGHDCFASLLEVVLDMTRCMTSLTDVCLIISSLSVHGNTSSTVWVTALQQTALDCLIRVANHCACNTEATVKRRASVPARPLAQTFPLHFSSSDVMLHKRTWSKLTVVECDVLSATARLVHDLVQMENSVHVSILYFLTHALTTLPHACSEISTMHSESSSKSASPSRTDAHTTNEKDARAQEQTLMLLSTAWQRLPADLRAVIVCSSDSAQQECEDGSHDTSTHRGSDGVNVNVSEIGRTDEVGSSSSNYVCEQSVAWSALHRALRCCVIKKLTNVGWPSTRDSKLTESVMKAPTVRGVNTWQLFFLCVCLSKIDSSHGRRLFDSVVQSMTTECNNNDTAMPGLQTTLPPSPTAPLPPLSCVLLCQWMCMMDSFPACVVAHIARAIPSLQPVLSAWTPTPRQQGAVYVTHVLLRGGLSCDAKLVKMALGRAVQRKFMHRSPTPLGGRYVHGGVVEREAMVWPAWTADSAQAASTTAATTNPTLTRTDGSGATQAHLSSTSYHTYYSHANLSLDPEAATTLILSLLHMISAVVSAQSSSCLTQRGYSSSNDTPSTCAKALSTESRVQASQPPPPQHLLAGTEPQIQYNSSQLYDILAWLLEYMTSKLRCSQWMTILLCIRSLPSLPLIVQTLVIRHAMEHSADYSVEGMVKLVQAMAAAQYRDALAFRSLLEALSSRQQTPPQQQQQQQTKRIKKRQMSTGLSLEQVSAVALAARDLHLPSYFERSGLLSYANLQLSPIRPGQSALEPNVQHFLCILQSCTLAGRRAIMASNSTPCDIVQHVDLATVTLGALLALLSAFAGSTVTGAAGDNTVSLDMTNLSTTTTTTHIGTSSNDGSNNTSNSNTVHRSRSEPSALPQSPGQVTQCRPSAFFLERIENELARRVQLLREAGMTSTIRTRNGSSPASSHTTSKQMNSALNEVSIEDVVTAIESCTEPDMVALLLRIFDVMEHNDMSVGQLTRVGDTCQAFAHCPSILFRVIGKPLLRALPGMSVHVVLKWLRLYMSNNVRDDSVGKALVRRAILNMTFLSKNDMVQLRRAGLFYGVTVRQTTPQHFR